MYQNYAAAGGRYMDSGYGSQSYGGYNPPSSHGSSSSTLHNSSSSDSRSQSVMSRMNESEALFLLQHLEANDLQHLLDHDAKLQDLINDLSQVKSLQVENDNMVATNKSLAEYNLSLQPKLEDLKARVAQQYETVNSMKVDLAENKAKLDSFVGQRSLDTMLALLQTEVAQTEERSEELADSFCQGNLDMQEFLTEFIPIRTQSHLRRIKSERFAELIRDSHSSLPGGAGSNSINSWTPAPPTHQNPYAAPGPAPYPTSANFGMPQPTLLPR